MNRFGEIADELTELIEELERGELAGQSKALRTALERAFAKACEAERGLRVKLDAEPRQRPARAVRAGGCASAVLDADPSGVVIQMPRAWRVAASARRLND